MKQMSLPGMFTQRIVNVATVKHRSPFRYPGGKTWLYPRVQEWIDHLGVQPEEFIEPFAGGAIIGLSVAFDQLARHVTLAELDERVAAVWQSIIERGEGPWLAEQILALDLTLPNVERLLAEPEPSIRMRALQTIVRNRINHGGILAEGAGKLNQGENGRGIRSRWYPSTLAKRIRDIDAIRQRLTFIEGDGLSVIGANSQRADVVFFVDPPYTASSKRPGSRLYDYSELDHERLFALMAEVKGDFLMTYDNVVEIRDMAQRYHFDYEAIPMKNTHHAQQTELLIGRDLRWSRP